MRYNIPMTNSRVLFLENLTEAAHLLETWKAQMPQFRQSYGDKYRFDEDRLRCTAAFCLLSSALGFVPDGFSYGQHKKPYIEGGPCFSMSHGKDCIAVSVSEYDTGVDIETLTEAPMEVVERVFTPRERAQIAESDDKDRTFFTLWTLKESYIKMKGMGLHFPLQDLEISLGNPVKISASGCVVQPHSTMKTQLAVCGAEIHSIEQVTVKELNSMWNVLVREK